MGYSLAADFIVLIHFLFIVFAVLGALFVLRWPRAAFVHLPAMAWAALIMFTGWICPLTPLENHYRRLAGEEGYEVGFIAHYLLPIIYPDGLTREIQVGFGLLVVAVNVAIYGRVLWKTKQGKPVK